MTDYLFHPIGEGLHLLPDEVLHRVALVFRHVTIDKVSGDRLVQSTYEKLLEVGAPDVILESHRWLFGRTIFVTLADDDSSVNRIRFVLQPYQAIEVEYDPCREHCFPLLEKLAGVLGYEIETTRKDLNPER